MPFDIPKLRRHDTQPYPLRLGDVKITLHTRLATLDTREVYNFAFRDRPERPKAEDKFDEGQATRAQTLETIARCCVASWEGVTEGGKPAECTPDAALRFLREADDAGYREEITAYLFWAQNPLNFRAPLVEASKVGEG